jgi:hypothetical protein
LPFFGDIRLFQPILIFKHVYTFSIRHYCTVLSYKVCNKVALHTFQLYCTLFTLMHSFYQVRQGRTWSRSYKSPSSSPSSPPPTPTRFRIFTNFCQLFANFSLYYALFYFITHFLCNRKTCSMGRPKGTSYFQALGLY